MAQKFVDLINARGGHAHLTHLPDIGIHGNSHFAFASTSKRIRRCHSPFAMPLPA